MIDHEERARLRALCAAATPGPWEATWSGAVVAPDGAVVAECARRAAAAFVAAARTALPALLDAHDEACAILGATDDEGLVGAARRVVAEHEAQARQIAALMRGNQGLRAWVAEATAPATLDGGPRDGDGREVG